MQYLPIFLAYTAEKSQLKLKIKLQLFFFFCFQIWLCQKHVNSSPKVTDFFYKKNFFFISLHTKNKHIKTYKHNNKNSNMIKE